MSADSIAPGQSSAFLSATAMPFPSAAGRGVRIAVIDSGVHAKHPHIIAKTDGIAIGEGAEIEHSADPSAWIDELGHGTAVMAAIQEKAPEAEYTAVKLFGKSLRATSERLLQAIRWAISQDFHLVNLSLGTRNLEYRPEFELVAQQATAAGVVIICAHSDSDQPVLPGIVADVVAVEVDWQLLRHRYRIEPVDGVTRFYASGFPRPLRGVPPARNLNGISFAVANMTGLAARAWSNTPTSNGRLTQLELQAALTAECRRLTEC